MPLQGLFASAFLSRAVPVAASVVVHASLATGLVLGAAGHARAGVAPTSLEIDVDVTPETPAPAEPPREAEEAAPQPAKMAAAAMPPTHHHDYPVPPSHDATPHDPNLVHDHADDHDHDHDHDAPAQAAPAVTADSVMPRFTIASGSSSHASSGFVSQAGSGNGGTPLDGAAAAAPVATLPVSAVQVPATLAAAAVAAYPPAARSDDREGDVGLEIVVDGAGRVVDAHLTRPAGHGFDESALEAIRRYRFVPAKKDGRAVRVRMPWIVQFRLR